MPTYSAAFEARQPAPQHNPEPAFGQLHYSLLGLFGGGAHFDGSDWTIVIVLTAFSAASLAMVSMSAAPRPSSKLMISVLSETLLRFACCDRRL
jgi:hypothetical protein